MVQRDDENQTGIEKLRFTMPDQPGMIYRFNRGRALTAEELIRAYMSEIGRKGGLATKGISTPEKRRASRANGKLGGRPGIKGVMRD
jgi:general stress protein YciG